LDPPRPRTTWQILVLDAAELLSATLSFAFELPESAVLLSNVALASAGASAMAHYSQVRRLRSAL